MPKNHTPPMTHHTSRPRRLCKKRHTTPPARPPRAFLEEIAGTPPAGPPEHKTRRRTLGTRQCPGTPRTQNEEENLGRQAASRNAHQINDNVRSFEAEETFTAHRHRGDPPNPKRGGEQTERGSAAGPPGPKMRRLRVGTQCIGG